MCIHIYIYIHTYICIALIAQPRCPAGDMGAQLQSMEGNQQANGETLRAPGRRS